MNEMNLSPLWLSLKTAGIATAIVFIMGIVLARLIARNSFKGKNGFLGGILSDFFNFQVVFTWYAVIIAAVVVSFPLMYQSAAAAFQHYNSNVENAALTMGASKWKVFWTISFPLAWPGLLAGLVLSFARALGEFGATLMLAGYIPNVTDTIPLAIYFAVESGNISIAKFWVIIIVAIGFSAILWLNWWSRRNMLKYAQNQNH